MASLLDLAEARLRGLLDVQRQPRPSMVGLLGAKEPQGTLASTISGYTPPQMQAMSNQQVMDYARNVASSARQNLQNQMSDIDRALVMDQGGINVGDRQALARLMEQVPGLMGATAYHGTPHTIRGKFDISKVGTGEGAQAYGHGMYFAENPAVATEYANKLGYDYKYMGKTPKENSPTDLALRWLKNLDWDKEAAKAQWKNEGLGAKVIKAIDDINLEKVQKPGNLYKVDMPDEYIPTMMDYDKPLGEQNEIVKKALNQIKKQITPEMKMELGGDLDLLFGKDVTPVQFLNTMEIIHPTGGVGIGEKMLNDLGVKGIRYKDAMSRGADKGTSNFVIFDPSEVKILEKNKKKIEGLLD